MPAQALRVHSSPNPIRVGGSRDGGCPQMVFPQLRGCPPVPVGVLPQHHLEPVRDACYLIFMVQTYSVQTYRIRDNGPGTPAPRACVFTSSKKPHLLPLVSRCHGSQKQTAESLARRQHMPDPSPPTRPGLGAPTAVRPGCHRGISSVHLLLCIIRGTMQGNMAVNQDTQHNF